MHIKYISSINTYLHVHGLYCTCTCKIINITFSYYRGAVGAVIVYDITNMASFLNVDIWMKELRDLSGPSTVLLLVGNKCDCSNRIVSTEQAVEFASN